MEAVALRLGWVTSAQDDQAVTLLRHALRAFHDDPRLQITSICIVSPRKHDGPATEINNLARSEQIPVDWIEPPTKEERISDRGSDVGREDWRAKFEERMIDTIAHCELSFLMLAGYMLIAGPVLLNRYRMLNLHPGLPGGPTGSRREVIKALVLEQPRTFGAMVHQVTAELDAGPPIAVVEIPMSRANSVEGNDRGSDELFSCIEHLIMDSEPELVVQALTKVLDDSFPWATKE